MLQVLGNTVLPIFSIILLGYFLNARKIIYPAFAKPANQIVYYVALPAMFIVTTASAPLKENFDLKAVLIILAAQATLAAIAVIVMLMLRIEGKSRGTFLQSSFHGNIGYMSYAIIYYALGGADFSRVAILSSFVMVMQNIMSVLALTAYGTKPAESGRGISAIVRHIFHNPIIMSIMVGVAWSASGIGVPAPLEKSLNILSGMAFPTALLLIGASLSFETFRDVAKELIGIGALKLVLMPLLGLALMTAAHVPAQLLVPGVILLASPPATVTYVMAMEFGGDPELAATSVSIHTMLSALSYSLFLSMLV